MLIFLVVITGNFNSFILYFLLILIHELGHFISAITFNWNVDKIYFYPYGGYTKFNEDINRPLKEELIILLMGPIIQIIFYLIFSSFLSVKDQELLRVYHYSILIFNLLPIYPLDGGKLFNILLSFYFPYKTSYIVTMLISYIVSIVILLSSLFNSYNLSFNLYLMITLIIIKLTEEYKKRKYYYNKFKLERCIKEYHFNKLKIINDLDGMMRDKRHLIKYKQNYLTEKQALSKRYKYTK